MRVPQQHAARSKCVLYRGSNSGTCTGDNVISDPEWDRYSRDQTTWEKEAPSHIDGTFSLSTDALSWARLPTTSATVVEGSTRLHMLSQHLINSCDAQTVDFSTQSANGIKFRCRAPSPLRPLRTTQCLDGKPRQRPGYKPPLPPLPPIVRHRLCAGSKQARTRSNPGPRSVGSPSAEK